MYELWIKIIKFIYNYWTILVDKNVNYSKTNSFDCNNNGSKNHQNFTTSLVILYYCLHQRCWYNTQSWDYCRKILRFWTKFNSPNPKIEQHTAANIAKGNESRSIHHHINFRNWLVTIAIIVVDINNLQIYPHVLLVLNAIHGGYSNRWN